MDDVKFKAFITEQDHLSYAQIVVVESLDLKNKRITFNGTATDLGFGLVEEAKEHEFKLMRFTGRKDDNDDEIYDGFICQSDEYPCSPDDDYVLVVEYSEGQFWGVKKLKANSTKRGISEGIGESLYEFESLKIIGNIYENADLLKSPLFT